MKCDLCLSRKAVIELEYLGKSVCINCLERVTRRRIARVTRRFNLIPKKLRKVGILFDFSPTSFFALYYFSRLGLEIFLLSKEKVSDRVLKKFGAQKAKKARGVEILVDPKCLDDFSTFFLENLFEGRFRFLKPKDRRIVRPFIYLPEKEIITLLKFKGIKGFRKVRRGKCYEFILKAEEIRPGSMFSIVRLFEKLESRSLG